MAFAGFGKSVRQANAGKLPFQDLGTSIKEILDAITENKQMGPDLLLRITYRDSITTQQATKPEMFAWTAVLTG